MLKLIGVRTHPAHDYACTPALVEAVWHWLGRVHDIALHKKALIAQARHPVHQVPHVVPLLLQQGSYLIIQYRYRIVGYLQTRTNVVNPSFLYEDPDPDPASLAIYGSRQNLSGGILNGSKLFRGGMAVLSLRCLLANLTSFKLKVNKKKLFT